MWRFFTFFHEWVSCFSLHALNHCLKFQRKYEDAGSKICIEMLVGFGLPFLFVLINTLSASYINKYNGEQWGEENLLKAEWYLFLVLRCFVIKLQNCFFITFANSVVARNTYHSIIYSQCRKFYWCLSLLFQPPFLNPNTENVTLVFFGSFLFFLVWSFQSAFWFWLLFWFLYFLVLRRRANLSRFVFFQNDCCVKSVLFYFTTNVLVEKQILESFSRKTG